MNNRGLRSLTPKNSSPICHFQGLDFSSSISYHLWNLDFKYPILSSLSDLLLASFYHWSFQFMGQPQFHTIHHLLYIIYSLKSLDSMFWYYNHHLWIPSPPWPASTSIKSWKSICFLYTCHQATKHCWRKITTQICLISLKFMSKQRYITAQILLPFFPIELEFPFNFFFLLKFLHQLH